MKKVIIYQDDILIMSKDFDEHLELLKQILNTLRLNGIKIQTAKCEFFKSEVSFLGHIISQKGIRKSPKFIEKIANYPKPENVTQLRQFLGTANFQRKFIDNFSTISRPLSILTGGAKRKKLTWDNEMEEAFSKMKEELAKEISLSFPDYNKEAEPLELYVDASAVGAGACIMQKQNGESMPIAYSSVAFNKAERNYSPIERELLALRWGVKNFRSFLFGVHFIIYTDHKPLLYLHNMSRENSRLMRTVSELEDFNYTLRYQPGVENQAADGMSRIIQKSKQEYNAEELNNHELPKGLVVLKNIAGGGDSLFEALYLILENIRESIHIEIPHNSHELRKTLVDKLLQDPSRYKVNLDRESRKSLRSMKYEGVLPREELILVAADIFNLKILVHYGMPSPIVYIKQKEETEVQTVHLQCLANVHFNPVICMKNKFQENVKDKCVNYVVTQHDTTEEKVNINSTNNINSRKQINIQTRKYESEFHCIHDTAEFCKYVYDVEGVKFCTIIDTGSQISAISESTWNAIKENSNAIMETDDIEYLEGIGKSRTEVLGVVHLNLQTMGIKFDKEIPLAVVKDENIPVCAILGANFLKLNRIVLNFDENEMFVPSIEGNNIIYLLKSVGCKSNRTFIGMMNINNGENNPRDEQVQGYISEVSTDTSDESENDTSTIKFNINNGKDYHFLQEGDHAIRLIKQKIQENIKPQHWKEKCINQFKRYADDLIIDDDVVMKKTENYNSILIPFNLLVKIVHQTHLGIAHIGRLKLLDQVLKQFWHPAIDKVVRDICKSCPHCQIFKISNQNVYPPVRKIVTSYPFELISVDLMLLPKTNTGNMAILVAVDHNSKWLSVVPIKDKQSTTVTKAFKEHVLASLPRIPSKLLSDNGPEFISEHFNNMLKEFNIHHIYSTPYMAASNGAVERCNRTITQLLKGVKRDDESWEDAIPRMVIFYNSTIHAQIGKSPSDCIIKDQHTYEGRIPIDLEVSDKWKEGRTP